MESNRDDAQKALRVALNSVDSDPAKALRFARKAASLYPSTEAQALVAKLEAGEGSSGKMNGGPAPASSDSTLRSRANATPAAASGSTAGPAEGKKFTTKQVEVVKRVRRCQVTEYYEILELKKDCEETHVKSAYRKVGTLPP